MVGGAIAIGGALVKSGALKQVKSGVGQWIKNKDITCWGASDTPANAQKQCTRQIGTMCERYKINDWESLDYPAKAVGDMATIFMRQLEYGAVVSLGIKPNLRASCSKKAKDVRARIYREYKDGVLKHLTEVCEARNLVLSSKSKNSSIRVGKGEFQNVMIEKPERSDSFKYLECIVQDKPKIAKGIDDVIENVAGKENKGMIKLGLLGAVAATLMS